MQAALRGAAARQRLHLLPAAGNRCGSPSPTTAALLILIIAMAMEATRDGPGDADPMPAAGLDPGAPAGAAPAAGASADPWIGALRRQAAEQTFDEAVLPLRNLFRDTSVTLELHRDVDRMRGEAIQELRMEVARLKGTVLAHEARLAQLSQALRHAQNLANLLPNDDPGAAAAGAGAAAARGAGDPPGEGGGDGAADERRTRRRLG